MHDDDRCNAKKEIICAIIKIEDKENHTFHVAISSLSLFSACDHKINEFSYNAMQKG
jgi:hypothetical protein